MPHISIIISFYERLSHLRCCLDSLVFSKNDFSEVIIADDGSSPATVEQLREHLKKYHYPIRHIWQPKDGFRLAASRNNGIRAAQGDYLIFLDCDFAVVPGAISQHARAAKPGRYVAGLCKYLPQAETEHFMQAEITPELLTTHYHNLPEHPIRREHFKFNKYALLRALRLVGPHKPQCSSHFSIYKQDLEFVNGYDENFVGWGGEDEDLSVRLNMAGFSGHSLITTAKVLHLWHRHELKTADWREGANVAYLKRKQICYRCANGLARP